MKHEIEDQTYVLNAEGIPGHVSILGRALVAGPRPKIPVLLLVTLAVNHLEVDQGCDPRGYK